MVGAAKHSGEGWRVGRDRLRLGAIATLVVSALTLGCRAPAQPEPAEHWFEAEQLCDHSSTHRLLASAGRAIEVSAHDELGLSLPRATESGRWWFRTSQRGDNGRIRVLGRGVELAVLEVPETGHWDRFEWVATPLLPTDGHVLELRAHGSFLLDALAFVPGGAERAPRGGPQVERDGDLELRTTDDYVVTDVVWKFRLIREQIQHLEDLLATERPPRVVLAAVSKARWPDPGTGAFQIGEIIYLREDVLERPWRYYAHELTHVFQESLAPTPRFFTEGLAFVVETEALERLYGLTEDRARRIERARARAHEIRARPRDVRVSDQLRAWGAGADAGGLLDRYEDANALVWSLHERCASGWLRKLSAYLRQPEVAAQARALRDRPAQHFRWWLDALENVDPAVAAWRQEFGLRDSALDSAARRWIRFPDSFPQAQARSSP